MSVALPALILLCSSASAGGTPWRRNLERAEEYAAQGSSSEAAAAADAALDEAAPALSEGTPEAADFLRRINRVYWRARNAAGLAELERRLAAAPGKGYDAWFFLGVVLKEEEKPSGAEKALKQALAARPGDEAAESELAEVDDTLGRFAEEAALLEKTAARKPGDNSNDLQLAKIYARLGRLDMAKKTYARARKVAGGEAEAYIQQGYFYIDTGDSPDALASFSAAIAVDTANPAGYHHMGTYLYYHGRYAEAEKNFRLALTMIESDPKTPTGDRLHTLNWLGDAVRRQGRYAEAENIYSRGLRIDPLGPRGTVQLLKSLANLYVVEGRYPEAERIFRGAEDACAVPHRCAPESEAYVQFELGEFLLARGRVREAAAVAERLAKLCDEEPFDHRITMWKRLANLYAGLHDDAKREALYLRLLPLRATMPVEPKLAWVEEGLAGMDAARGRAREAAELYEKAGAILEHGGYAKDAADARAKARALGAGGSTAKAKP